MYASDMLCLYTNSFSSSAFMDQVEDAKIDITSQDLSSFLYEVYNLEDEAAGLFCDFLLVWVSTYLIPFNYDHSILSPRYISIFLQDLLLQ